MLGEILICAAAIMASGIRATLLEVMPDLECLVCRGAIEANIGTFGQIVLARQPAMTILDADSVNVQEVLETFGRRVLGSQGILGKIVVLTTKPDEALLFTLAKYGARAYVSSCLPASDLAQMVRSLLDNDHLSLLDSRTFADPDLALVARQRLEAAHILQGWQGAVEEVVPEDDTEQPCLTNRELRLLRGLSCGMNTRVAAKHAGVSYGYAKTTIPLLVQKLQAGNRTGAVMRAWQRRLIDLPETEMILRYAGTSFQPTSTSDEWASGLNQHQMVTRYKSMEYGKKRLHCQES